MFSTSFEVSISYWLETEFQGYGISFKICNLGSKQPYFNSAHVVRVPIFSFTTVISQKKSPVNSHIHRHRKHQILFLPLFAVLFRPWKVKPAKLVEGHRNLLLGDLFETGG